MDWLVIVGSYLSLSIALIGVKAKQSATPTLNTSSNNIIVNHSLLSLPSTQQSVSQNSIPNSAGLSLINPMEQNNPYNIRGSNTQIMQQQQQQGNIIATPLQIPPQQQSHSMSPLLPTPLLPSTLLFALYVLINTLRLRFFVIVV